MDILLHICCGPCATYCVKKLKEDNYTIIGFNYNPGIHPYTEFQKRMDSVKILEEKEAIRVIYDEKYRLAEFLRLTVFHEADRCGLCYYDRLKKTALKARELGINRFTSSLLISPHQPHKQIVSIAERAAEETKTEFVYYNFRKGYQDSVKLSKEYGMYRQQYCGCIYSEYERCTNENIVKTLDEK